MSTEILTLVTEIVRQNVVRGEDETLVAAISPDFPLFGVGAAIDSLTLVNVIIDIEDTLNEKFNKKVCLTDDEAVFREPSPFVSIQTLVDFIDERLRNE